MKLVILDDELCAIDETIQTIKPLLRKYRDIDTRIFFDATTFLQYCVYNFDVYLVILDINLKKGDFNGIEVARRLNLISPQTYIIFLTQDLEKYIKDLTQISALCSLTKKERYKLPEIIAGAKKKIDYLYGRGKIEFEYTFYKETHAVDLNEVYYFASSGHDIIIQLKDRTEHFREKLNEVEKQVLPLHPGFIRVNKSYLVNQEYVVERAGKKIKIRDIWINVTKM